MRYAKTNDPREFWEQVSPEGCWEWLGARDQDGYGQTRIGMRRVKAHRKAWEIIHGPVPDGLLVLHSCDNPPCVRPNHLFIGTHRDNQRDKWAKGRGVKVRNGAKLTDAQAAEIRSRYATGTIRQRDLGEEFGIEQGTVSRIIRNKNYREA